MSTEKNSQTKIDSLIKHVKLRYENLTMYPEVDPELSIKYPLLKLENRFGTDAAMFNLKNPNKLVIFCHGNADQLAYGPTLLTHELDSFSD